MNRTDVEIEYLKDYREFEYQISQLELVIELHEKYALVSAKMDVQLKPMFVGQQPALVLNGQELELVKIELNQTPLEKSGYNLNKENLTILSPPESFGLTIETKIYPAQNRSLSGLYKSNNLFCTQCEAEGFRRITFFPDRPDVMTIFSTKIVADKTKYPVLLSNGNPVGRGDLSDNRHWVQWDDPFKKPAYLFAMVAGSLKVLEDSFTTRSGRTIQLQIFVEPENIDKCGHAMSSLKKAMSWDEKQYGREYDLDIYMIVAVNDFNAGAMENKGLNIFNAVYILALPKTATDNMYENIEGVIAHEYFHNWTGNRITCRDWFQLSLKEGLTVFRDQQFTSDMTSETVKRIKDVSQLRTFQFAEDAGGMAHPVRPDSYIKIDNFYTATVYEKGAEVIRMMYTILGENSYKKAMDLYFERHDGQAVTTEDFVQVMEDSSGIDLEQFRRWYFQSGTPEITATTKYNKSKQTYTLSLQQKTPPTPGQKHKKPFHIPLGIGLLDQAGIPLTLKIGGEEQGTGTVLSLLKEKEDFVFEEIGEKPVLSLNRKFSAPIKLIIEQSDKELILLMAKDEDLFNRWEAAQQLALRIILSRVKTGDKNNQAELISQLIAAILMIIKDKNLDRSFVALMMNLPEESYLIDQLEVIDIDGVCRIRDKLRKEIAASLTSELFKLYDDNLTPGNYRYTTEDAGKRKLKNTALSYLVLLNTDETTEFCRNAYHDAGNMTDELAALSYLSEVEYSRKQDDLNSFQQRWMDDPLVMDMWFSLQTRSKFTKVAEVKKLMQHPKFDNKNPNRLRALIGVFCTSNLLNFHHLSGEGYKFLADEVLRIDSFNPLLAARMLSPFSRWHKLDENRERRSREQLERILKHPGVSPNTYEIVTKTLAAKTA
jgi:aminopeptidase N